MDFRNKWQKKRNLYRKPQTDTTSIILIMYQEKNVHLSLDKKTIVNIIYVERKEAPHD
jgi:hypothetical protein